MKIVGFTGYAQSGKDTAAEFLVERGWTKLSFAEPLRAAVYALNPIVSARVVEVDDQCCAGCVIEYIRVQDIVDALGYEEAKRQYPEYRALLQRFGTDVGRALFGESFWTDLVLDQIEANRFEGNYVLSDVRFANEADLIQSLGGKVWRVVRPGTGAVNGHISDTGIDSLIVDGVVPNASDLDHFRQAVLEVVGIA